MRIVVCVKQVPGSNEVRLDPETNTIIRDSRQSITNPFDSYAIEEAVRLSEKLDAETVALSMGIPATELLLRDAVSRGIDSAVLLSDRAFAGADTLATAYTLSLGIEKMGGADLILCGKMAVDGDTAQIGPELAGFLGVPHLTDVCEIEEIDGEAVVVQKLTDSGTQRLRVELPALLTVVKDINMPKMPTIAGIRRSLYASVEQYDADDLMADTNRTGLNGSPTCVVRTWTPERETSAYNITGSTAQQVRQMANLIREVTGSGEASD